MKKIMISILLALALMSSIFGLTRFSVFSNEKLNKEALDQIIQSDGIKALVEQGAEEIVIIYDNEKVFYLKDGRYFNEVDEEISFDDYDCMIKYFTKKCKFKY